MLRLRLLRPPVGTVRALARPIATSSPRRMMPGVQLPFDPEEMAGGDEDGDKKKGGGKDPKESKAKEILKKISETAGVMVASLAMLGLAGLMYHRGYREHALNKIERAFTEGDPAFELTMHSRLTQDKDEGWVVRTHQDVLDQVMAGEVSGRYYLLIGEKGTGKTSMLLEAMKKSDGKNCTILDAHADPEIFRIRLGKALNFEFHEDYLGSLFSIRGPRDTTALLDIERAFNMLEKVALRHVKKNKKPLVLVINSVHLIRDDEEGRDLVELLQQKAESLSGSGLVTMIFNSDDYWFYERLKKLGTRLDVINIHDFSREHALQALGRARRKFFGENVSSELANKVYNLIGGRPQHIASVASQPDMIAAAHQLIDREKTWFLNHCVLLGEDMDDDVMEHGKFSSSAMLLMKAMVDMDEERRQRLGPEVVLTQDHELPRIPLWRARQIMTRPDYIQAYDNINLFTIDSMSRVKPDSVVMMQAFREIASLPGFEDLLQQTLDRVGAIESLGRTRELVAKDLVAGGKYKIKNRGETMTVKLEEPEDDGENAVPYDLDVSDQKYWWQRRPAEYQTKALSAESRSRDIEANAIGDPISK